MEGPSTFKLVRLARLIDRAAAISITIPASAVEQHKGSGDLRRGDQPAHPLIDEPHRQQLQGDPIGLRGEDLHPLEPAGVAPPGLVAAPPLSRSAPRQSMRQE